jgi:hypothetical protein
VLLLRNDSESVTTDSTVSKLEEDEEEVQAVDEEEEVYSEDEYDKAGIGRPKRISNRIIQPVPLKEPVRISTPRPRSFSPSLDEDDDDTPLVVALTTLPFLLSAVVSASTLPAHVKQTDLRVDVFCTPLNIALSSLDIITIIDAINDVVDVFAPKIVIDSSLTSTGRPNNYSIDPTTPPPRVDVLSPLCKLNANFTLDHLNLSLLSDRENDSTPMVTETLRAFATISLSRGSASHAVSYSRELALKRLQKLAFPWAAADNVLTVIAKVISKGQGVDEALQKVIMSNGYF